MHLQAGMLLMLLHGVQQHLCHEYTVRCRLRLTRTHTHSPRRSAFRQLLAAGDREAAHPLLRWLLAQGPLLGKRAYVGYHLTLPEVGCRISQCPACLLVENQAFKWCKAPAAACARAVLR